MSKRKSKYYKITVVNRKQVSYKIIKEQNKYTIQQLKGI